MVYYRDIMQLFIIGIDLEYSLNVARMSKICDNLCTNDREFDIHPSPFLFPLTGRDNKILDLLSGMFFVWESALFTFCKGRILVK